MLILSLNISNQNHSWPVPKMKSKVYLQTLDCSLETVYCVFSIINETLPFLKKSSESKGRAHNTTFCFLKHLSHQRYVQSKKDVSQH